MSVQMVLKRSWIKILVVLFDSPTWSCLMIFAVRKPNSFDHTSLSSVLFSSFVLHQLMNNYQKFILFSC